MKSQQTSIFQLTKRMLHFLKPTWKIATIAGLVVVIRVAAEVLSVYFLSPAVTNIANGIKESSATKSSFWEWVTSESTGGRELFSILVWMTCAQLFLAFMNFMRATWDTKLSMHVVYFIRSEVYDRLQRASLALYDRHSSGELINRALNDLQAVRNFVNTSLLSTLDILSSLTLYLGFLSLRSPWLALAALIPVPIWSLIIFRFSKRTQAILKKQQVASDKVVSTLTENLSGLHVVRAFGTENSEIRKYSHLNRNLLTYLQEAVTLQSRLTPTLSFIGISSHILLFILGAWLVQKGSLEVGDLMLLGATMAVLLSKLQQINQVVDIAQKAWVSSRRLFEILDLEKLVNIVPKKPLLQLSSGRISFRNVSFSFEGQKALDDVTAVIPGGQITALVGPTASGKSTLAGLIARFYELQSGSIEIDGQDIGQLDVRHLRHHIGYVFQDTFLFSQSVRDNIRYGREDVSDEMVQKSAEIAHAHDFITNLPNGYDTVLGQKGGVMLSGGQRQRLSLARALVYDPEILVLDDATAALDPATEKLIYSRLDPIVSGRTVLMIANRLSSLEMANKILVLDKGRIVQQGTHHQLLSENGPYRDLVQMQLQREAQNTETEEGYGYEVP